MTDPWIPVNKTKDIPPAYRPSAIGRLLEYHNLKRPFRKHARPELLIGMCMDNRKYLRIPDNFAFIIRTGGANLRYSEFKISYAIGVGGVSTFALIGHNHCGMVNLLARKELFIKGLVRRGGWTKRMAQEHFEKFSPMFEIGDPASFILSEVKRLRGRYPKITIAPMFYNIENNRLYLLREHGPRKEKRS